MVLLLSYDLKGHERPSSYRAVAEMIERHATSVRRPLFSQWLVETGDGCDVWSDRIGQVADTGDRWLVVRVQSYAGWLDKEVWDWLSPRL